VILHPLMLTDIRALRIVAKALIAPLKP
jgi:hypothetical protein